MCLGHVDGCDIFGHHATVQKPWNDVIPLTRNKSWGTSSIVSRDPNLSRKPPETQEKRIRFLKRRMVEQNGKGINP